jgi:ABC-type proline/glycine betaine transport system ATPase subunit
MSEAALLADHIAVMRVGRIEQIATPQELFTGPATDYVARLVEKSGAAAA